MTIKHKHSKLKGMPFRVFSDYFRSQQIKGLRKLSVWIRRKAPAMNRTVLASRLSAAQGSDKQRTESYKKYGEGAAQPITQRCARNISGVTGFARRQAAVARGQGGMASIVAVSVMMVLVTLIALGFARLMDRAAQNSQAHQASSVATYAAQSAINDISTYIKTNPTAYSSNCVGTNSLIGSSSNPGPFYNDANLGGSTDRNVQYTCLLLNQTPADLAYQALPAGGSRVVKATTSAYPGSLDKLMISWQPTNTQITGFPPAGSQLLDESTWSSISNNYMPMLRVTLYPVPTSNSLANAQANSKTVFLYPQPASGTVPVQSYSSITDGSILPVRCTNSLGVGDFTGAADYTCNMIFSNLSTSNLPDDVSYFYIRLTPIYGQADIKIKANDLWGQSVNFVGVQAIADVTAKAAGVAKRLQARLDIGGVGQSFDGNISPYTNSIPEYSVRTADALCKRFQHYSPDLSNYFYDFVALDSGTQDSVCHTSLVTNAPALTLSITGNNGKDSGLNVDSEANNPDAGQSPSQKGTVYVDSSATVNWQSQDAAYNCNASGGWSGNQNGNSGFSGVTGTGSQTFSGVSNVTSYSLTCSGPGGTTSPKTVTLWPPPRVSISGPSSNPAGNSYTVSWSSANASTCNLTGNWPNLNIHDTSGSETVGTSWDDHATHYFTVTCYDPVGRSATTDLNNGNGVPQTTPNCSAVVTGAGNNTNNAGFSQISASCSGGSSAHAHLASNTGLGSGYVSVPYNASWFTSTPGTYCAQISVWIDGWSSESSPNQITPNVCVTVVQPYVQISGVNISDCSGHICTNSINPITGKWTGPCNDSQHTYTICGISGSAQEFNSPDGRMSYCQIRDNGVPFYTLNYGGVNGNYGQNFPQAFGHGTIGWDSLSASNNNGFRNYSLSVYCQANDGYSATWQ